MNTVVEKLRVDGKPKRINKHAFSKISVYVWMGSSHLPASKQIPFSVVIAFTRRRVASLRCSGTLTRGRYIILYGVVYHLILLYCYMMRFLNIQSLVKRKGEFFHKKINMRKKICNLESEMER